MSNHARTAAIGAAVALSLVLTATPAAAKPATGIIVLPNATSAEGIAIGRGATFYATDLFAGDIFRGNLQSGAVDLFIDAPAGRQAVGLKYDQRSGLLFVAGGATGQGYVYDGTTGAEVATFQFGPAGQSFINDVVITRDGAWFTDSLQPHLYLVPSGQTATFSTLTVTGPAADTSGDFNLNGIAATPNGRTLIVAHTALNALFTVDPDTGASALLVNIGGPDGLLFEAGRLWVAEPFMNQIARLRVNPDLSGATTEAIITSPDFQIPTTVARHGSRIATVNAKFDTGIPPTADQYEVVIVNG